MVVWISQNQASPDMENSGRERGHYDTHETGPLQRGPYVHLDQFLEEVMEGSKYAHDNGLVGNPVLWAIRELAGKLKQ